MSTLDRYLTREVGASLLGALAVVVLALLGGALYEVLAPLLARGADPLVVSQYLAFRVPEALVRGMPLAFLFALLLVLSRMGEESELKALLAGGISKVRVLFPLLLLGTLLFALCLLAADSLVPRSLQQGQNILRQAVLQKPRALLQPGTRLVDAYGRIVYVGQVHESSIGEVRVITAEEVLVAAQGRFEEGALILSEGLRVTYGGARPRTVAQFERAVVPLVELSLEPPGGLFSLSVAELRQRIAQYKAQGLPYHAEMTALQRKWAEPAAVYAFALFAVGLAFFLLGGSRSLGMLGVVVLTFIYYATWSVGRIMGEQGVIPPVLAAWGPNLLYGLAGLILLQVGRR
ncbi:MAG: LptF/LptG family permease [Meiothermus sp.]|uniref:LptF/LptG family permease n=1 Tax=Meiothermus sp. TaxID=1955249 RepID=UPI0025ECA2E1|nr:LptF/LptG family permease [Meiothermus sp.]MCS7057637.1 LptF/LptG family permease [Meiothermus sp.]MCS7193989.1 LptF/LptG family permease [Meiothermus sp.]MCX7740900.1 LptF/LptG family permease [Meiothermus sp.]MDW8090725.1 LptF/LptG family permease [Meiothermus sp.]MDW8480849.1 LptF/LptG family permease [Meiothermus sp.]